MKRRAMEKPCIDLARILVQDLGDDIRLGLFEDARENIAGLLNIVGILELLEKRAEREENGEYVRVTDKIG